MAIQRFWTIAFRDLIRSRRRTFLTIVGIALSMVVLMLMASFLSGVVEGTLTDNIRINTGHVQLRGESYEVDKLSLLSRDLLPDPQSLARRAAALPEVQSAAPVLWASGILSTPRESASLRVLGIQPDDAFHEPIRQGLAAGGYLSPGARGEILIGQRLAQNLDIGVGQRVSLSAGDSGGAFNEGVFTVAGIFSSGVPSFDQRTAVLTLDQAQSFTRVGDRASSIIIMLADREQAGEVAAALAAPGMVAPTWEELNNILLETADAGAAFYYLIYLIIILVVAVLIANTLLMSVFERAREIGILASLGMNRRQLMVMVLLEALILALVGIAAGFVLGLGMVSYLTRVGISIGDDMAASLEGIAYSSRMYAAYDPGQYMVLSLLLMTIVLVVSLYPAWYAARLEPVEALRSF